MNKIAMMADGKPPVLYQGPTIQGQSYMARKRHCDLCLQRLGLSFVRLLMKDETKTFVAHESCYLHAHPTDPDELLEKHYYDNYEYGCSITTVPAGMSRDLQEPVNESSPEQKQREYEEICALLRTRQKSASSAPVTPSREQFKAPARRVARRAPEDRAPVRYAPVIYSTPSMETEKDETIERRCTTCSSVIHETYVRIKLRLGGDFLYHEPCWKKCSYNTQERLNEVFRIYRYQSDGKLLEKIALPAPVAITPLPLPPPIEVKPAVAPAKPVVIEYQPSWREVEVSDYESLKRARVNKEQLDRKRARRRQRAEEKAKKYLDLSTPKIMRLSATAPEYVPRY